MIVRAWAAAILLYLLGFALFAVALPRPAPDAAATDAIVVVTGGPGRIPRGVALLQAGRARRMFVSGVDRRIDPATFAREFAVPPELMRARIDLGRESVDTRSNAQETADWMQGHGFRSLRLVTTDWHMARARYELRRSLGRGVTILPDAVPSAEPGLVVLLTEYTKYLLRRVTAPLGL